jgi:hypothetical protein
MSVVMGMLYLAVIKDRQRSLLNTAMEILVPLQPCNFMNDRGYISWRHFVSQRVLIYNNTQGAKHCKNTCDMEILGCQRVLTNLCIIRGLKSYCAHRLQENIKTMCNMEFSGYEICEICGMT